jgi:hypothetical protein
MNNQIFLQYTFVLSNQLLDYAFKPSINWPVAVVLSTHTFNWKKDGGGEDLFSVVSFYLIYCLQVHLLFYGFQGCASRAETCFLPRPCVGNDEWLEMWVISSTCLVLLLNLTADWIDKQFYCRFCLWFIFHHNEWTKEEEKRSLFKNKWTFWPNWMLIRKHVLHWLPD